MKKKIKYIAVFMAMPLLLCRMRVPVSGAGEDGAAVYTDEAYVEEELTVSENEAEEALAEEALTEEALTEEALTDEAYVEEAEADGGGGEMAYKEGRFEPDDRAETEAWPDEEHGSEILNAAVPLKDPDREIISVVFPVVEDRDPFNFIIDPKNILYSSFRDSEDIHVEEGANLLFINRSGGGYDLSGRSDPLCITNQSTVPIDITITARLENIEGINLVPDEDGFGEGVSCDLFLMLVDDKGNERPLSVDEDVSITVRLDKAPIDAYSYEFDEESGEYRYASRLRDIAYEAYYFGLRGGCNKEGDWSTIDARPRVLVSWNAEPVMPDKNIMTDETEPAEEVSGDESLPAATTSCRE